MKAFGGETVNIVGPHVKFPVALSLPPCSAKLPFRLRPTGGAGVGTGGRRTKRRQRWAGRHGGVCGASREISEGREGARQGDCRLTRWGVCKRRALQHGRGFWRACCHRPAAAMGDARAGNHLTIAFQQHRKTNGADILIMPTRKFLGGENRARRGAGDENPRNHLMRAERIAPLAGQDIIN